MNASTITAIATPTGRGGIGIIKISGNRALSIAAAIFRRSSGVPDPGEPYDRMFESHKIYHGHIVDTDGGQTVDEVLLTVMKAPRSYTREDVVEINAHAGTMVQRRILELVISQGARLAEPGEFTKRAYLNGRIDLTQAEGVIDIINAKTDKALDIAAAQVDGGLGRRIAGVRNALEEMMAQIEAEIDFPEDADGAVVVEHLRQRLADEAISPLANLLMRYRAAHSYRDGVRLAVVGRPNVGKSSLVNRLLEKDRIIVTPIPGTTRDIIETFLDIHGIPVTVLDTAGIQETDDPIEIIGIDKTRTCIQEADFVLFVIDAGVPLKEEDVEIYETIVNKPSILVINKIDLPGAKTPFTLPDTWDSPVVETSAIYGWGVGTLKDRFAKMCVQDEACPCSDRLVPNYRHKIALERTIASVEAASAAVAAGLGEELIAIDLREAIDALGEIIGKGADKTILERIFSRFCIGK